MNKKDKWFKLRLTPEEKELLKSKVEKVGYITQSDYIRRLITDVEIPCYLDKVKLNDIRRLAGLLGKNTGLLKMYIMELEEPNKKMIDKIINNNEKIKKEIRQILEQIKGSPPGTSLIIRATSPSSGSSVGSWRVMLRSIDE